MMDLITTTITKDELAERLSEWTVLAEGTFGSWRHLTVWDREFGLTYISIEDGAEVAKLAHAAGEEIKLGERRVARADLDRLIAESVVTSCDETTIDEGPAWHHIAFTHPTLGSCWALVDPNSPEVPLSAEGFTVGFRSAPGSAQVCEHNDDEIGSISDARRQLAETLKETAANAVDQAREDAKRYETAAAQRRDERLAADRQLASTLQATKEAFA